MSRSRGLKIGVIGVGSMGQHHARVCATLSGASLVAVADTDPAKAKEMGYRYKAEVFKDYKQMLPLVEAVIIASPTATHFEFAAECLNAEKNILVEKPLTKTSAEAQRLAEMAKEKGLVVAVGHIERFNPAFEELSKLVRKEKILGINIHRLSPFPERISDANVIQDMMIHDLDLLLSLLPQDEIESLKAEGSTIKSHQLDKVSATIYFHSGIIAKLEADRIFGIKTRKITVTCERGLIEADLLNKRVYLRDLEHPIPSVHHTKNVDQLTAELLDFLKAIKEGRPPKVSAEDGYKAIKLAEEVERACS
jgi:virulence factor